MEAEADGIGRVWVCPHEKSLRPLRLYARGQKAAQRANESFGPKPH